MTSSKLHSEPTSGGSGGQPPDTPSVLVTDDDETLRVGFRLALLTEGYAVETARNGEDALRSMQGHEFDLLVLDLRMPGIGGLEVVKSLQARGIWIPVVLVSDAINAAVLRQAFVLGIVDTAIKPMNPEDFRKHVNRVVEEERSFASPDRRQGMGTVERARCLLRRRRVREALDALAQEAKVLPASWKTKLWLKVARSMLEAGDGHALVTLSEMADWSRGAARSSP